jgi:class 3 adenylate cyclase
MTQQQREEIAKGESKAVFYLRSLTFLVLIVSAISISLCVYFYMTDTEKDEFETQYHSDAHKVLESVGKALDNTLGATDAFIVKMMAYADNSNSTWPFVTMPHFAVQATKLLKLSKAFSMSVNHIVQPEQRAEWQEYASNNDGWLEDSLDVQEKDEDWKHSIDRVYNTSYELTGFLPDFSAGIIEGPTPYMNTYLPSWQQAPMVPNSGAGYPYNWDGWQIPDVAASILHAFENQRIVFTESFGNIITDPDDPIQVVIAHAGRTWSKSYIDPDENEEEPIQVVSFPMINSIDSVRIDVTKKQPIVGAVVFVIFLRELIKDILPSNSRGLLVVMEHSCGNGQAFTYQLDGPNAIYLGAGDLHDTKYDSLGYSLTFGELMDTTTTGRDSSYTGIPLDDDYCTKTVKIYPSQTLEDDHKTSNPIIFTVITAAIFIFTSLVFMTYDSMVSHRQKIVMNRALASGAIVSSLFPEKVRNQLYQEKQEEHQNESNVKNVLSIGGGAKSSKPLADVFEETTIYFADLAGFTKWSSTRTPTDVFELLEALYGAFDAIAARRGVFKIETIGDCYVAVTGIPEPQDDHAVIMVKFARDCMLKMNQIVNEMVDSLGADTAELEMRTGLHSGRTTAGVLRGDKGRFQLFGDTVNTASRMESNGVRGRIHVSQATADALTAQGKGQWLVPREDKIVAKGKGEMQTYFIDMNAGGKSVGTSLPSDMPNELANEFAQELLVTDEAAVGAAPKTAPEAAPEGAPSNNILPYLGTNP